MTGADIVVGGVTDGKKKNNSYFMVNYKNYQ